MASLAPLATPLLAEPKIMPLSKLGPHIE